MSKEPPWKVDCKTFGFFFLKITKEIGKAWRVSLQSVFFSKSLRKSVKRGVRVSLSVFSFVPDLLFDCFSLLEYAKIRTVLQSTWKVAILTNMAGIEKMVNSAKISETFAKHSNDIKRRVPLIDTNSCVHDACLLRFLLFVSILHCPCFDASAVTNLPNITLIRMTFPKPTIKFHDFPGLENEML